MSAQFTKDCGLCAFKSKEECVEETDLFVDSLVEPDYFGFGQVFPLSLTVALPCSSLYPY